MIDRKYSISSFLALRYSEKPDVDFSEKLHYRHPEMPSDDGRILVSTTLDIDAALQSQIDTVKSGNDRIGIFLSGGMDSSILASYLPGIDAYTFRFLEGEYKRDELHRAEAFAEKNGMHLHYIDID